LLETCAQELQEREDSGNDEDTTELAPAVANATALLAAIDAEAADKAKGNSHPLPELDTGKVLARIAVRIATTEETWQLQDCKNRDDFCVVVRNLIDQAAETIGIDDPQMGDELGDVIEDVYDTLRDHVLDGDAGEYRTKFYNTMRTERDQEQRPL
jgi:hypothetical protein